MNKAVIIGSVVGIVIAGAAAAFAAGYVPGTGPNAKRQAKEAVAAVLKDPWSAEWRGVKVATIGKDRWACGEVNAKNSNGAYAGWERWRVGPSGAVEFPTSQAEIEMTSTTLDSEESSLDLRGKYLPADEAEVKSYVEGIVALRDRRIAFREVLKKQLEFEKFWQAHCILEAV